MGSVTGRAGWRTSSYSGSGEECFDVDFTDLGVELRHSRQPEGALFFFTDDEWNSFLTEVVNQDIVNTNGAVRVVAGDAGWAVEEIRTGNVLRFTHGEVHAFRLGVLGGEFTPSTARADALLEAG